jgi:HD-GYP domain-containing protein (c-di-GMP phosphodiesterase class II)
MVDKNDFDFIEEDDIEKAMKNLIGDKGNKYDHSKVKKKRFDNDEEVLFEEDDNFDVDDDDDETNKRIRTPKKRSNRMRTSSDRELDFEAEIEKEAREISTDQELSTQEKIEILTKKMSKRYYKVFDKFKKLTKDEMEVKENILKSFIESERDILLLESTNPVKSDVIYKDILDYSRDINALFEKDSVINERAVEFVNEFAYEIVKRISPNQNEALRMLGLTDYIDEELSYLAKHSVNTAILSVVTAIEMSKVMSGRVDSNKKYNLMDAQGYSDKVFNENELIELAMVGLLHDITLKNTLGNVKRADKYPKIDMIRYQMHPKDSYYLLSKVAKDVSQKALNSIRYHHENEKGTGFPEQVNPRLLNKFSKVLAFVVRYEELAFGSPFTKHYGPSLAMNYLMRKERSLWDGDVLLSFLKTTSLYPVGSYVELDSDEIGIVHSVNKNQIKRPTIKILVDSDRKPVTEEKFVDLSVDQLTNIKKIIHPYHIRRMFKSFEDHFGFEEGFLNKMGTTRR